MFEDLKNAWDNYTKAMEDAKKRCEEITSACEEFRAFCMKIWADGGFPEMKCKLSCGADLVISDKKVACRTSREALAEAKEIVIAYLNDKKVLVDSYYKN